MDHDAKPLLLSQARVSEKVLVHHDGDASKLVDMLRQAVFFETLEDLYTAMEAYQKELNVVEVDDRIEEHTPMGYGDVRLQIRTTNGQVSTVCLLFRPVVAVKADAHALYEEQLYIRASALIRSFGRMDGGAVITVDMFNYMHADSVTLITGFPSGKDALEYARRRTRDSVEDLRVQSKDNKELWWDWLVYGEDCLAFTVGTDKKWCAYSELNTFTDTPATATERDWTNYAEPFDLQAVAFAPL